jgi:hypothetical protein
MATCLLCEADRFCADSDVSPSGVLLRCTRDPGHTGDHVACGEETNEHPIRRWKQRSGRKRRQYRARSTRASG